MSGATAEAHPNIALVKYWGKQPGDLNLPATPSLSVTLDTLTTRTRVTPSTADAVSINGQSTIDPKVDRWLAGLRESHRVPSLRIESTNDFPTGSGLASSASGFAALITAIDAACGLGLTDAERSEWARRGSGSAARSIYGGFVALSGAQQWRAEPLLSPSDWPLGVVVGVTTRERKRVGSTEGMELSRRTSPYFEAWTCATEQDFHDCRKAVLAHDFAAVATIAESSCLKMHALMLSSLPGLIYWNAGTIEGLHVIRQLREDGVDVFFTVDAGPQVKAICMPAHTSRVADALAQVPGIERTIVCGLGAGARIVDD